MPLSLAWIKALKGQAPKALACFFLGPPVPGARLTSTCAPRTQLLGGVIEVGS